MAQGIKKKSMRFTAIESEGHLVKVGSEMLCAHAMPCSDNSTLEQGECILDRIGMNVPINIDLRFVPDGLMAVSHPDIFKRGRIGVVFIGHDHINICTHVLTNILCQCAA